MRQKIAQGFLIALLFVVGFDMGREKPLRRIQWLIPKQEKQAVLSRSKAKFHDGINPSAIYPVTENKPFVVVIPSYNNEEWCEKNLKSVFSQDYKNYRILYVDDASSDHTYEKVKTIIQKHHMQNKVILIRNEKRLGAMANLYQMIHLCENHEIVVSLDGDDWFAHDHVLKRLNEVYANPDVWMSYGQNITYPTYQIKLCKPFDYEYLLSHGYRSHEWVTSQLRTFYAGLFKKIDRKDLVMNDSFLKAGCDFGYMFPMLEMSGGRFCFLEEVLYIYNQATPINDFKIRKKELESVWNYLQSLPPYEPLDQAPYL